MPLLLSLQDIGEGAIMEGSEFRERVLRADGEIDGEAFKQVGWGPEHHGWLFVAFYQGTRVTGNCWLIVAPSLRLHACVPSNAMLCAGVVAAARHGALHPC